MSSWHCRRITRWADRPGHSGGRIFVDTPFVLFPAEIEPDTHAQILGHAAAHGLDLQVEQEATGLPTILGLVAAGVGAAFVVDAVADHAPHPGLTFAALVDPLQITTSITWDPSATNPAVATFLRTLNPSLGAA